MRQWKLKYLLIKKYATYITNAYKKYQSTDQTKRERNIKIRLQIPVLVQSRCSSAFTFISARRGAGSSQTGLQSMF